MDEQQYQALLAKRLESLKLQQRLQADIDAATKPRLTAEQQYQQTLAARLKALREQKRLQDDIDAATKPRLTAEQQYQQVLQQRLRALAQQKRLEEDIRKATTPVYSYREQVQLKLRELQERRATARDEARLAADVRTADLRGRYGGRFGGFLAGAERFGQSGTGRAVMGGAAAAGVTIGGLARQGFSGTVEQNRFDFELKLLSREVAAAFKPLIEVATQIITRIRKTLEKFGPEGQDALMYGGAALGAYGTYRFAGAAGRMLGLGGGLMGGAAAGAGVAGMAGGAAVGAGAGGAALAGAAGVGAMSFWGRARAAGSRFLPGPGKLLAIGATMVAANQFRDGQDSAEFRNRHGENADELDRLQMGGGVDALQKRYAELRAGRSAATKFQSWVGGGFGYAGQERDTIEEIERRLMAQGVTPGTGKKRRQVTPADFGYEEVGSAYKRASVGFLSTTPGDSGEDRQVPILQEIAKLMAQAVALAEKNGQPKAEVR